MRGGGALRSEENHWHFEPQVVTGRPWGALRGAEPTPQAGGRVSSLPGLRCGLPTSFQESWAKGQKKRWVEREGQRTRGDTRQRLLVRHNQTAGGDTSVFVLLHRPATAPSSGGLGHLPTIHGASDATFPVTAKPIPCPQTWDLCSHSFLLSGSSLHTLPSFQPRPFVPLTILSSTRLSRPSRPSLSVSSSRKPLLTTSSHCALSSL